jgi:hypothetical protein
LDELRSSRRFALLIRTAKLVCDTGEYLCIVRDISATGVRLRLFHPVPPAQSLRLELGNGDVYPIECVWEADAQAGFRFLEPVNVHIFMEEPSCWQRRPMRLRLRFPVRIIVDGSAAGAIVCNLSRTGALIETQRYLALGQKLHIEAASLPPILASVCWRSGEQYGLSFRQTFTFEELARLAVDLQPFEGSRGVGGQDLQGVQRRA